MNRLVSLRDEFNASNQFVMHLDQQVAHIRDPFIVSRYTGFYALIAASAFETTTKKILIAFAATQNPVLLNYCKRDLEKINGHIKIKDFKNRYLPNFGDQYSMRFESRLTTCENIVLKHMGFSIISSYGSLIACRHQFAHTGTIPSNSSYSEIQKGYRGGKYIMSCLQSALAHT